jgi:isopenicillin-N N-acyltransferase like protein
VTYDEPTSHGKGELKYVKDIPILTLAGKPEEIGEQLGLLALKPASRKFETFKQFLKERRLDLIMPLVVKFGEAQFKKWPESYQKEFEAMVKAGGVDRDLLLIASTFSDLRNLAQCSALMIGPCRAWGTMR